MNKFMILTFATLLSVPAFAVGELYVSDDGVVMSESVADQAISADAVPAAQIDQALQAEAARPPWHGPGRPFPPPRDRRGFECQARDILRIGYRARGWDLRQTRNEAVRECQRRSPAGRTCYLLSCQRD